MSTITDNHIQAELALAAYSTLYSGISDDAYTNALRDGDKSMTVAQAAAFAAKWNVVDQYTDITTGASATVFQAVSGGPKYLAIRGTDGGLDFVVDYFIFNGVPSFLNPQYQSIKTQVQTWLGDGTLNSGFVLTGHSLGGYLAAGLVANFGASVSHAYLFNAPGNNSTTEQILQALGLAATADPSRITSIRADAGISPIAALGNDFSTPIPIHIENQFLSDVTDPPGSFNHSQRVLTDSLALYALFAQIDPSVSVDSIGKIIKAASAKNGNTLELTLDALRTLFQQNYQYGQLEYDAVPTLDSGTAVSRNDYYANLQSLQAWLKDNPLPGLAIQPLAETSAAQIAALALADTAEGMAYRYALYKLNPFAVTGSSALYDGINAHNELKLYTPTSNAGRFTEQYLKDRAAMLTWKLSFGTQDTQPVGDTFVKPQGGTPFYFEDFTSNAITTKMRIGGGDTVNAVMSRPLSDFNLVVFGSENNDLLTGQGKGDRLYGAAGADTLTGNGGNDHLEGGAGYDTYVINAGDGYDTVLDSDGSGVIKFGTVEAKGSTGIPSGKWHHTAGSSIWIDQHNGISYSTSTVSGETRLLISKGDNTVLVKGWSDGELGISLGNSAPPAVVVPAVDLTLSGDKKPLDTNPNVSGVQADYDTLHNLKTEDTVEARQDILYGSAGNDHLKGLTGIDYLDGKNGDDLLEGGTGNDAPAGGEGADHLKGEDGNEILLDDHTLATVDSYNYTKTASLIANITRTPDDQGGLVHSYQLSITSTASPAAGGNDVIEGGLGDDIVFAGGGDDLIDGGDGADVVFGEGGQDLIDGGTGNDILDGGDGNDTLNGGKGNDILDSGAEVREWRIAA